MTPVGDLIGIDDITAAADRISGHVLRTPTVPSPGLTAHFGVPVTCKLELLQRSVSFKPRGAFLKLLGLSPAERAAGVVAVSGGNHGLALADVAGSLGVAATVVMPESAPRRSIETARTSGADVRLTPDMASAFALLDELVAAGLTLVHPFDDRAVLAAQGTVGLELATDAPDVTDVLVSVGGGALIAGVAAVRIEYDELPGVFTIEESEQAVANNDVERIVWEGSEYGGEGCENASRHHLVRLPRRD